MARLLTLILLSIAFTTSLSAQELVCVEESVGPAEDGEATLTYTPDVTVDSIEVYLHGILEQTLEDGPYAADVPVEITVTGLTRPQAAFFCVVATVGDDAEDAICCTVIVSAEVSAQATDDENHDLDPDLPPYFGFFTFDEDIEVGDVQMDVHVSLFDIGELDVSVTSEQGTTVVLYSGQGEGLALDVDFWELGDFSGDFDFGCDCPRFPFGPGRLADISGENLIDPDLGVGTWLVRIDGGASEGFVDSVAIRITEAAPPFAVTDLVCQRGEDPTTSRTTWTTPVAYDSLEVVVDGGDIIVLEGPFEAGEDVEFVSDPVALPATVVTCVRGVRGNARSFFLCCFTELIVDPVTDLSCTSRDGAAAQLSWIPGREYDDIEIRVDGELVDTIDGLAEEWTLDGPYDVGDVLDIDVTGVLTDVGSSEATRCRALILEDRDVEVCGPVTFVPDSVTTVASLAIDDALAIEDLEMLLDLSTVFVTSWNITLESPRETAVTVHDVLVGNDGEFFLVYADDGDDNAPPYDCACSRKPSGPGAMGDFDEEPLAGDWTLSLISVLAGGTVNAWCLRVDGCEILPPDAFTCELSGGSATLEWIDPQSYDDIEVLQDGVVIATLTGDEETYTTEVLDVGRYVFQLRAIDDGCRVTSVECPLLVGIVDVCAIDVVVDAADFEAVIEVAADIEIAHTSIAFRYGNTILPEVIAIESPEGTVVRLHDEPVLSIGIDLVYDDDGVANGSPWQCGGCAMRPSGPGELADFEGEGTIGDWVLEVDTILPGGSVQNLCLMFEATDAGGDGVVDAAFRRGDVDGDGVVTCLLDAVALLNWNYLGGPEPDCLDAADLDDDGAVHAIVDALACLGWEFQSGTAPPEPGPTDCGTDGTTDPLSCEETPCD